MGNLNLWWKLSKFSRSENSPTEPKLISIELATSPSSKLSPLNTYLDICKQILSKRNKISMRNSVPISKNWSLRCGNPIVLKWEKLTVKLGILFRNFVKPALLKIVCYHNILFHFLSLSRVSKRILNFHFCHGILPNLIPQEYTCMYHDIQGGYKMNDPPSSTNLPPPSLFFYVVFKIFDRKSQKYKITVIFSNLLGKWSKRRQICQGWELLIYNHYAYICISSRLSLFCSTVKTTCILITVTTPIQVADIIRKICFEP